MATSALSVRRWTRFSTGLENNESGFSVRIPYNTQKWLRKITSIPMITLM